MQLVIIKWTDAKCSLDGEIPELPTMTSVGFLISKDKTKTVVVSLLGTNNDPHIVTAIPSCLIKSIKKISSY